MTKLRNLLLGLFCLIMPAAWATGYLNCLKIELNTGETYMFPLSKNPRVQLTGSLLKVNCDDSVYVHEIGNVKAWEYVADASKAEALAAETQYKVAVSSTGVTVTATSGHLNTVSLYAVNGTLLKQAEAAGGTASLPLGSLPKGPYLLQVDKNAMIKILKK